MSIPPKMSGAGGEKGQIPAYDPAHPNPAPPSRAESHDLYDADMKAPHSPHDEKHHHEGGKKEERPHHSHFSSFTKGSGGGGTGAGGGWASKLSALGSKAAAPINALAQKVGAEAFLPSTMDKECEKAARILRAFCKDGVYNDQIAEQTKPPPADGKEAKEAKPKTNRTIMTIPSRVISRAVGLAIFTTARVGYAVSGATGSGILIARMPDGRWSPPSGIQVHTVGAGLVMGIDIYDCVMVINTPEALAAFSTNARVSLGSDVGVTAGPWGAGGRGDVNLPERSSSKGKEKELKTPGPDAAAARHSSGHSSKEKDGVAGGAAPPNFDQPPQQATPAAGQKPGLASRFKAGGDLQPVFSYVKSRGLFAGLTIDGTIVTERKDANAAFYGVKGVSVAQILKGDVPLASPPADWERHARALVAVIRGAEGYQGSGPDQSAPLDPPVVLMSQTNLGTHPPAATGATPPVALGAPPAGAPAPAFAPPPSAAATKAQEAGETYYPPPPPGPPPSHNIAAPAAVPLTKEQEAAQESAAARAAEAAEESGPPPPRYSMIVPPSSSGAAHHDPNEQPPPFVADGHPRPDVGDSKTGHH